MTPEQRIDEFTRMLLDYLRREHEVDVEKRQVDGLDVWFRVWYDLKVDRLRGKIVADLSEGLVPGHILPYVLGTASLEEKDLEKRRQRPLYVEIGGHLEMLLEGANTLRIDSDSFQWLQRFMKRHRPRGNPGNLVAAFREMGVDLLKAIEGGHAR